MARGTQSAELMERVIAGERISPGDLDALVTGRVREDVHLDYKHAEKLRSRGGPRMIREYVSAFANSAGGTLICGIDAPEKADWSIVDCRPIVGQDDIAAWASNCLTEIAGYLTPLPEPQVVDHPAGKVLLIATPRTPSLVPCVVDGKMVYYLRLGHQTLEAPPYLVSDLVLGRREHPILEPEPQGCSVVQDSVRDQQGRDVSYHGIQLRFHVANLGLQLGEGVNVGVVTYAAGHGAELNRYLRSFVQTRALEAGWGPHHLQHVRLSAVSRWFHADVEPFSEVYFGDNVGFRLPRMEIDISWHAGLYVKARSSAPEWYQLCCTFRKEDRGKQLEPARVRCERTHDRPLIAWGEALDKS